MRATRDPRAATTFRTMKSRFDRGGAMQHQITPAPMPFSADIVQAARRCLSDAATLRNIVWRPDFAELQATALAVAKADLAARKGAA